MSAPVSPFCLKANRRLDTLVRTSVDLRGRARSSFHLCGVIGLILAFVLAQSLVIHAGRSPLVMIGLSGTAVGTFFALAMITKLLTGEEKLIYYHHEIAIIVSSAVFLRLIHQPVLAYLDTTILGVGLFLACGRIGCFMVGCCHGRPSSCGVRYRQEHVDAGFTPYYRGVRLFPIQLVESVWVLFTVTIGAMLVWTDQPAGIAFAWYVVAYDAGRFLIEFGRGDPDRPDRFGFSTPQWLSVILTWIVVVAGWLNWIPGRSWHLALALTLTLLVLMIGLRRQLSSDIRWKVRTPAHVREIARIVDDSAILDSRTAPSVQSTSCGIMISAGMVANSPVALEHYTLSATFDTSETALISSAEIIENLRAPYGRPQTLRKSSEILHVLVHRHGEVDSLDYAPDEHSVFQTA